MDRMPASWLFCLCARPLRDTVNGSWYGATMLTTGLALGYLSLLILLLCGACRGAAKAKKRRKKNDFELQMLNQGAWPEMGRVGGGVLVRERRAQAQPTTSERRTRRALTAP